MDPAGAIKVNSVFLNGDTLSYSNNFKYYTNRAPVNLAAVSWSVNGSTDIPTFSYANLQQFPTLDTSFNIPDSLSKDQGLTLTIKNIANFTRGNFLINNGTGSFTGAYIVELNAGDNVIVLSSSNLASLATGPNGQISLVLENSVAHEFDSKNFKFVNEVQYVKRVKINP